MQPEKTKGQIGMEVSDGAGYTKEAFGKKNSCYAVQMSGSRFPLLIENDNSDNNL